MSAQDKNGHHPPGSNRVEVEFDAVDLSGEWTEPPPGEPREMSESLRRALEHSRAMVEQYGPERPTEPGVEFDAVELSGEWTEPPPGEPREMSESLRRALEHSRAMMEKYGQTPKNDPPCQS